MAKGIYSTHLLCSGGATLIATLEIPGRIFQRRGWRRDPSSDRYARDTVVRRLEVTRAMLQGVAEFEGI